MQSSARPTDCVLFIDDAMSRFVIAWMRTDADENDPILEGAQCRWSPKKLARAMGISQGQVSALVSQAVAVGIIEQDGSISELAQKVVNNIVRNKIQDIGGR
jgi:hypothetical protein